MGGNKQKSAFREKEKEKIHKNRVIGRGGEERQGRRGQEKYIYERILKNGRNKKSG